VACLKRRHLVRSDAPAFAPAGELPYAVSLRFLINELAKARLLGVFDYSALCTAKPYCLYVYILIVGLDATTKGPSPLVGESKVSRESKVSCSENNYFVFTRILYINN
jgi:hypothetical protein